MTLLNIVTQGAEMQRCEARGRACRSGADPGIALALTDFWLEHLHVRFTVLMLWGAAGLTLGSSS